MKSYSQVYSARITPPNIKMNSPILYSYVSSVSTYIAEEEISIQSITGAVASAFINANQDIKGPD